MREHVIEIVVDSWEIECCAPPPVVGEQSSWRPVFVPSEDHPLASEHRWTVVAHDPAPRLHRDGVTAAWGGVRTEPPQPGEHCLHGFLYGAAHLFEDLPPLAGRVRRIRVISDEREVDPENARALRPVPGSVRTRDVDASPRWFAWPHRQPNEPAGTASTAGTNLRFAAAAPGPGRYETGVVVDLLVTA